MSTVGTTGLPNLERLMSPALIEQDPINSYAAGYALGSKYIVDINGNCFENTKLRRLIRRLSLAFDHFLGHQSRYNREGVKTIMVRTLTTLDPKIYGVLTGLETHIANDVLVQCLPEEYEPLKALAHKHHLNPSYLFLLKMNGMDPDSFRVCAALLDVIKTLNEALFIDRPDVMLTIGEEQCPVHKYTVNQLMIPIIAASKRPEDMEQITTALQSSIREERDRCTAIVREACHADVNHSTTTTHIIGKYGFEKVVRRCDLGGYAYHGESPYEAL